MDHLPRGSTSAADGGSSDPPSSMAPIKISIRKLDSSSFDVTLPANSLVSDLHQRVLEETGQPVATQRLIFRGRVLLPTRTLDDYSITDGVTVHLVSRTNQPPPVSPAEAASSAQQEQRQQQERDSASRRPGAGTDGADAPRGGTPVHTFTFQPFPLYLPFGSLPGRVPVFRPQAAGGRPSPPATAAGGRPGPASGTQAAGASADAGGTTPGNPTTHPLQNGMATIFHFDVDLNNPADARGGLGGLLGPMLQQAFSAAAGGGARPGSGAGGHEAGRPGTGDRPASATPSATARPGSDADSGSDDAGSAPSGGRTRGTRSDGDSPREANPDAPASHPTPTINPLTIILDTLASAIPPGPNHPQHAGSGTEDDDSASPILPFYHHHHHHHHPHRQRGGRATSPPARGADRGHWNSIFARRRPARRASAQATDDLPLGYHAPGARRVPTSGQVARAALRFGMRPGAGRQAPPPPDEGDSSAGRRSRRGPDAGRSPSSTAITFSLPEFVQCLFASTHAAVSLASQLGSPAFLQQFATATARPQPLTTEIQFFLDSLQAVLDGVNQLTGMARASLDPRSPGFDHHALTPELQTCFRYLLYLHQLLSTVIPLMNSGSPVNPATITFGPNSELDEYNISMQNSLARQIHDTEQLLEHHSTDRPDAASPDQAAITAALGHLRQAFDALRGAGSSTAAAGGRDASTSTNGGGGGGGGGGSSGGGNGGRDSGGRADGQVSRPPPPPPPPAPPGPASSTGSARSVPVTEARPSATDDGCLLSMESHSSSGMAEPPTPSNSGAGAGAPSPPPPGSAAPLMDPAPAAPAIAPATTDDGAASAAAGSPAGRSGRESGSRSANSSPSPSPSPSTQFVQGLLSSLRSLVPRGSPGPSSDAASHRPSNPPAAQVPDSARSSSRSFDILSQSSSDGASDPSSPGRGGSAEEATGRPPPGAASASSSAASLTPYAKVQDPGAGPPE